MLVCGITNTHLMHSSSPRSQVYEAVPCRGGSGQNEWRSEAWSICTINAVDDLPACGEGVQSRKIRSVNALANCSLGITTHSSRSWTHKASLNGHSHLQHNQSS